MNFGEALEALKKGLCVCRKGWNGKNMHIYLEEHFKCLIPHPRNESQKRKYASVICMYTAEQIHQPGWLASQADMLAEDWEVI